MRSGGRASGPTATSTEDVVVIGGGVIGVCCAQALAREGRSVLLLEAGEICAGSSWGNSGLLTTSACAPEAAPGAIGQATRWLLDRDGPFRIKPRLNTSLPRWLLRFRQFCNEEAASRSIAFLRDRIRENVELVEQLAQAPSTDFAFRRKGLLVLFTTEQGLTEGLDGAKALQRFGIASQALSAPAVREQEPAIRDTVAGGILYPEDAHLDPGAFVASVAELARSSGARIETHTPVLRLHGAHRIDAIETAHGLIRPQEVVLASGAWAPRLSRNLGIRLLIEPGRGFSVTRDIGEERFARPLRLWEVRTVVCSMGRNLRVTSKLDLVGMDTRDRERRARSGAVRAERYLSLPAGLEHARTWTGLRPLTPDGLPMLGRSSRIPNLILAVGHGHLGVSLGAVTGNAVARIAAGEMPDFDQALVRPERFGA